MSRIDAVMQTDFPRLRPDMPIRRAVAAMIEAGADAAPVEDDSGALLGILTQKDCFRPALMASYYQEWAGSVAEHMTSPARAIEATEDLVTAAETFASEAHRVYPVTDRGRVVGMLRRADVLAALIRQGG